MRVVFMGTPVFAVVTIEALHRYGHEIAMVVTQPDRPVGRGQELTAPPVKVRAVELGLNVFQPERVTETDTIEHIIRINPDAIIVVGYGQIIPAEIFRFPKIGCLNIHASLLPYYRGAAPVNWAIARGETRTGVTTMQIEKQLDAGDIILQRETSIAPHEKASELSARLSIMGAELIIETLDGLKNGNIDRRKQKNDRATYAPILKREDGMIDWTKSSVDIFNRLRGFDPWPGSYTYFREKILHIRWGMPVANTDKKPGEISFSDNRFLVGCGDRSALEVESLQLAGKSRVSASEFIRGYNPLPDEKLGG